MSAPVFGTLPAAAVIDLGPSRGPCTTIHVDDDGKRVEKAAYRFSHPVHGSDRAAIVVLCLACAKRRWPAAFR